MDLSTEVRWSDESYSLEDLRTGVRECPLLLKVERGLYGTTEDGTIPADQMVLLHKWEVSERVVAVNREGLWLTIPIDHKHKLEVIKKENSFEKLGPYIIQDVIKRFKPPVKARFDPNKRAEFYIQNKLHSSKDFGFFELTSVHYMDYAKASVISTDGKINRHRISILPMDVGVEFFIGISMHNYPDDYFSNLLQEVSRSSGPLVNDNTNVYGFSGITECDDTTTLSRPTAKTRAESITWGRRAGSRLYSSTSEPPKDDPTPIRRHTMPNIEEPLSTNNDAVGDQAMGIYANHDVATTRNKRQSDHTDTERGRSESFAPIPIYENVEGLRRAQDEADGIRHNEKDEGVSNDQRSDLDKADSSSQESLQCYENVETAGGHGSGDSSSSEEDYYNHPGGAPSTFAPGHPPGVHKRQEDAKNHGDSTDDVYVNQATASLIQNREPYGTERQEKNGVRNNDPHDHQLDSSDAIYENRVTASSIQRALSDRRRQQRDRDDHNGATEGDHRDSPDAIYQNQVTSSSKMRGSSSIQRQQNEDSSDQPWQGNQKGSSASINKKPAPPPRIRKNSLGTQGCQDDGGHYINTVRSVHEDPPESLYQNQNEMSASSSDVSGIPPPAPRCQGDNRYINAPVVSSPDGSGSLPRYRPSELFKGSTTARRSNREADEQSTISTLSMRSSDYSSYWHTDDAMEDIFKQGSDVKTEKLGSQGVKHPAKLEVPNLSSIAYLSASSDNSDYDDTLAEEISRRSRRTHTTVVDKGPLRLASQDHKSEGTDNDNHGDMFADTSSTTSSIRSASIRSKSAEVTHPRPESIRKRDDSQPILPPKDYTSKGKDSIPPARKSDISTSAVRPGNKASVSAPPLPPRDPIPSMPASIGKKSPSINTNSMPREQAPLPPRDPTPSMPASIGKKSPSINTNSMPREQAPLPPEPSVFGSYKTQTFHSLKDIPEDISNLGVTEVSDCLSLLNLGEFIDPFAAMEVDGKLLKNFTMENLVEGFGMGSVSANKVILLIHGTVQSQNKVGGFMHS